MSKLVYKSVILLALMVNQLWAQTIKIDLSNLEQTIAQIDQRVGEILPRAYVCPASSPFAGQYSHSPNKCGQGDIILFSGIGCLVARISGNESYANDRCRDVFLGQRPSGQWVRGQSRVEEGSHFSRDMGIGVLSAMIANFHFTEDQNLKNQAVEAAKKWINFINTQEEGKYMCYTRGIGNACNIVQGSGFASMMYRTFRSIGAIDDSNRESKLIKKIRRIFKNFHPRKLRRELSFQFHDGYQVQLKSIDLFFHAVMDTLDIDDPVLDNKNYRKLAKKLFKKSEVNPWYQFLYFGVSEDLLSSVFNHYCPIKLPDFPFSVLDHYGDSGYAWQSKRVNIAWENGDGHDCIYLLEVIKAYLQKNLILPIDESLETKCPGRQKKKGRYQGLMVCEKKKSLASLAKCRNNSGVIRYKKDGTYVELAEVVNVQGTEGVDLSKVMGQDAYCLRRKPGFYQSYKIQRWCPWPSNFIGLYNTEKESSDYTSNGSISPESLFPLMPVCSAVFPKKISSKKCLSKTHRKPLREGGSKQYTHCLVNRGTYFTKKKIGRKCPLTMKYVGRKQAWEWPLCRPLFAKSKTKEQCEADSEAMNDIEFGYCLYAKKGYFRALPIGEKPRIEADETVYGSENTTYKTEIQRYTAVNKTLFREFSDNSSVDSNYPLKLSLEGSYSFRTKSDRAGDLFVTRIFKKSENGEQEIFQDPNLQSRIIEDIPVIYNRLEGQYVETSQVLFEGYYETQYATEILIEDPTVELIFKTYLVTNNGQNTRLAFTHREKLVSRNLPILKDAGSPFPVPFRNFNDLSVPLSIEPTVDIGLNNNTLYQVQILIRTMDGKQLAQSPVIPLNVYNQTLTNIIPNISAPAGNYVLTVQLMSGTAYMRDVKSFIITKLE